MVEENISSALIFEDDAEWDIMIRAQLAQFAVGARYIQGSDDSDIPELHSPYGDDWDALTLGHCGAQSHPMLDSRYWVAHDDPTVPPFNHHQASMNSESRAPDVSAPELQGNYTRIIYETRNLRCMYGYSVSLRGAQRLLYYHSIEPGATASDRVLSGFCTFRKLGSRCIGPWPSIIDQYRPAGPDSKSSDRQRFEGTVRSHGESLNIVFPAKTGLLSFLSGDSTYKSQWPDDTLIKEIDPMNHALPRGEGYFLTKDKFKGYDN